MSAARALKVVPGLSGPVEDYLKAIYDLERSGEAAETNAIAKRLNIAPPSVSGMVRRLARYGLITHERYKGARLTAAGRKAALQTIRRHRVIEAYLTEALGYSWDRVHDEAERLEHAASDDLIDRMAKAIGEPETDPHGAPIPSREGTLKEKAVVPLASLPDGATARVERVSDKSAERLRYLAALGVVPGVMVKLMERAPLNGPITVKVDAAKKTIGADLAAQILVTRR